MVVVVGVEGENRNKLELVNLVKLSERESTAAGKTNHDMSVIHISGVSFLMCIGPPLWIALT